MRPPLDGSENGAARTGCPISRQGKDFCGHIFLNIAFALFLPGLGVDRPADSD
jgi:hypothetical protein